MLTEFLMGILLAYPFHETIPLQVHHWPQDRPVQILSMSLCLAVGEAARQHHVVGPLLVLTSQVLTCHSSETVDKLFTTSHLKQKRELK